MNDINQTYPPFFMVRQLFRDHPVEVSPSEAVERELGRCRALLEGALSPGAKVAILAGSRGVAEIASVVEALAAGLVRRGYEPFVVPAMGSHGGAQPAGQQQALARLGISQERLGIPFQAGSHVDLVARTDSGLPVYADRAAVSADAVIPVNRIMTHTNFEGRVESGILKMLAVGLGRRESAAAAHRAALTRGLGEVILEVGQKALAALSVPFGLAVVENGRREVAHIRALSGEALAEEEAALLVEAKRLKPKIPFDFLHLLIVDQMGKNFSGTGVDTKVIGRMLQTGEREPSQPQYLRIYVRDLSPETGGNAHGVGLVDFISGPFREKIDLEVTATNGITACSPQRDRVPPALPSDREAVEVALRTAGLADFGTARVVRIANTRDLEWLWISEPLVEEARQRGLKLEGGSFHLRFEQGGNLPALDELGQDE